MARTEQKAVTFDPYKLRLDMAARGWEPKDLAAAAKVSDMTVSRFLGGKVQTVKTARKLALALGYSVRRYLVSRRRRPPAPQRSREAVSA